MGSGTIYQYTEVDFSLGQSIGDSLELYCVDVVSESICCCESEILAFWGHDR